MSALLIVRAEIVDATARDDFDAWYQNEHLPEAVEAFNARRAWRGWSDVQDNVHVAFYEFDTLEAVRNIASSDAIKGLIAEFDRMWGSRVVRTRDIVESLQLIER